MSQKLLKFKMLPMDDKANKTKTEINPQSKVIGNCANSGVKLAGFASQVCHLLSAG